MKKYVTTSLETHLFFGRIMKEHSLFLLASFPCGETNYRREANWHREQFENLLRAVVELANSRVRAEVLDSGEVTTQYTEMSERQTSRLTGIPIDVQITDAQKRLQSGSQDNPSRETVQQVRGINQRAIRLLNSLIALKENILKNVSSGNLYTSNYPLLIEHILREAKWYRQAIVDMENGQMPNDNRRNVEIFWNQIMMEHAQFIRGLLDPTEEELICSADEFAKDYRCLLEMARQQDCRVREELSRKTRSTTEDYVDFKGAGTEGITESRIRSVILPLLADHVLREANHYLRLLEEEK